MIQNDAWQRTICGLYPSFAALKIEMKRNKKKKEKKKTSPTAVGKGRNVRALFTKVV